MATYAIGDIQGCYQSFKRLLKEINFKPSRDTLWLAGDLVNRGKGSLDVLRYVIDLGKASKQVLGNHDFHLLAAAEGLRKLRNSDTLEEVIKAPDAKALIDWLSQQPLLHYDKHLGYVMTHAGIPPIWKLKKAQMLAAEIEKLLSSKARKEFLENLFGNEPLCWSDDLEGEDRHRSIVNYFTRMRFCQADGSLDFTSKNDVASAPKGYAPWFSYPSKVTKDTEIIFGHWAALEGHTGVKSIHALDTGCVWGNHLTAMRLEDRKKFKVAAVKQDLI
ncbi:symmetrical bis(5'-nucleosyl)-tetraphosphatase [Marinospirillum insulare]|uniref:Bis(5'-nucleosyl)-tetraphosphatase, symmetrical n=1 Tax=Marinospirillum insulare TaxID=217169 RepID=A0ABQ5ZYF6_9GAMM|nr:symmetrical bis(5'-nucleosyl)-tetraphosphatase [Marinospirillum insulare]GLR63018.1 bis(5'-nucleosyl)-tetraphosphatase, symmetrical [Marinospirillum insulare]